MSDNIKVVVKVRPLISREIEDKLSYQWKVINSTLYQLDANGKESGVQYTFDKVYDVTTKTADVYKDVAKPIVEAAIAGFNGTIFAYGQTSSGKTYTMSGTDTSSGIIQLAVLNLFERIKCIPDRDFLVRVSYIEIYNETLKDLLKCDNDKIKIRETPLGIKVETTEKFTSSPEEVLEIMREGEANRQTGATNMNEESSRSHSIFQITIESREHTEGEEIAGCVNVSQLNLVDLAGSERAGQTGATGLRFKEGTHINKSLSVLALVIKQLSEGPHKHANYRDSKLTRILQNSLGGNAKTSIICAVTPAAVEETISTLQFANRAKAIKNKPEVNAVATDATKLQDLTKQLAKLQAELVIKNNIEQDNRLLMKQIENLQKMILNGFGQSRVDIGGARRKTWCAPRRMTISTSSLRAGGEHEDTAVQRFCTPTLKYNPLALPTAREFQPIQRPSQLPSVSEERAMVTPPPKDKKVNFNDEIIDLDSDEDNASNTSHCSPYHKCYNASKTPPCVLRKKAKSAEKDLKDIVELTKREKMYNPEVVEYIEKLEESTNRIAKLEDEINSLSAMNMEKESELALLKDKIEQTIQEVQTFSSDKVELEAQCKEYNTKLTDLEVIYETLKTKTKLREDELLSLINERTNKNKVTESSKSLSRTIEKDFGNFMDMSKDISLVSDNDSSIDSSNNEPAGHLQRLVEEMRTDVTAKNEAIVKLESDLLQQKITMESLESACTELREQIKETNSVLKYTEDENCLLKSSIETLNSTINSQKQNLESANNYIQSYDVTIKDLQAKLVHKKYDDVHISINDISIEQMIDNEEKFIANNENMRNIIHSLKNAIDSRNKELEQFKSKQASKPELLTKNLEEKEQQIIRLVEEVEKSKETIQENMDVINKLMEDNKNLIKSTDDLSAKLLNTEKQRCELETRVLEVETKNKEYANQLHEFNENHDKVLKIVNDLKENLSVIQKEKEALLDLKHDVISKDNLISELKSEISTKDSLISTLNKEQLESQDYLCKWKSTVTKVQQILSSYITDVIEQEELVNGASNLEKLCDQLNFVENTAMVIVSQKDEAVLNNNKLQDEIEKLEYRVESLIQDKNKTESEKANQNQQVIQLNGDLQEIQKEISKLVEQNSDLDAKLQQAIDNHDILNHKIIEKEEMITSIKNEENNLRLQLEKVLQQEAALRNEIETLQSTLKSSQAELHEILQTKSDEYEDLKHEFHKKDVLLDENYVEIQRLSKTLEETICNQDKHFENIHIAAVDLLRKIDIQSYEYQLQNSIHCNVYSNILSTLDKATNGILLLKSSNEINNSEEIKETIELLDVLKEQNHQLISKLSYTENENSSLTGELEQMKIDNKIICYDLLKSNETLKQLQDELHEKLFIIENLESKINEWKNNFSALEESMKQQLLELQISNSELESLSQNSIKRSLSIKINESYTVGTEFTDTDNEQRHTIRKSLSNILVEPGNYSPQSLLTLCCNRIIDAIQPSETELESSSSNTNFATTTAETQTCVVTCDCDRLLTEKDIALDEILELKAKIDHLQSVNINLLKEQEEIRKELKLLMDPAHELQKKISSHKTYLSTLTATTYAENKLLKSQVKVLQHHNNRIYNVCQRDIPGFKTSLEELSSILKNTALVNRLEANIKRFSLPEVLDRNSSAFKDESTLDGDLLMLDTNVTIASADNTLLAQDQTCLDGTQIYLETDLNTDVIETIDPNIIHTQLQMLSVENQRLTEKLTILKAENMTLHEKIGKLSESMKPDIRKIDAQNSPMKFNSSMNEILQQTPVNNLSATEKSCEYCMNCNIPPSHEKMTEEINKLNQELLKVQLQNSDLEKRCNIDKDDILSKDRLALNISILEKDNNKQLILINQLTKKLSSKNEEFSKLQEENDQLSTQIMESIDETDDLRKEVDTLKDNNKALSVKCGDLEELIKGNTVACIRCARNTSASGSPAKSVLNRSRSDSESSSRCNKLSTLQSELLAGREDCKTISEDVATIKNHFERGELSMSHGMDLDDSMGESNVFAFSKELHEASPKHNQFKLVTELPEESTIDIYALDKTDCFNYYTEKTGAENNFSEEIRIIEVMKMFYNNLVAKHGNEVDNLVNKLKDFEESRNQLHEKMNQVNSENSRIIEEIKQKDKHINGIANTLRQIRNNIDDINEETCGAETDKNTVLVTMFKNNILSVLDHDFDLSSVNIFENLIDKVLNKDKNDLVEMMDRYSELQGHIELLTSELSSVTDNLNQKKCQLDEKEKEYNLLKAQKEKVHEITSAVTRDIVQRERDLTKIISNGCQKLIERNIMTENDMDTNWPVDKQMSILIEKLVDQSNQSDLALQEKHNLALEVTKSKTILEEKDEELESLKSEAGQLRELCKNATNELLLKNEALETLKSLHEQLDVVYKGKVEENEASASIIENMKQELDILKATVNEKDSLLLTLQAQNSERNSDESDTKAKIAELMESINSLEHENKNLKSVNEMITKESEENAVQLAKADDTIKKNKTELDKLTAEILTLNQSMKDSMSVIESVKSEAKSLLEQNVAVKKQFDEANELCSQLKLNMKTHEKTAEIQCKIIARLKQEKETRGSSDSVKASELKEWVQKCESLQKELVQLAENKGKWQLEAQELREAKESLERRVSELESSSLGEGDACRRRQSLLDSKRALDDKLEPDHKKMEAYFSMQEKPDDMFMDVDDHSNRSTPARNRRSDSFQSRHEESEESSRPGSAQARRQRRQSLHDQHRPTRRNTKEHLNALDEITKTNGGVHDSELASLKDRFRLCQEELEELKERYREVDEECEICAQYLRERDQQCMQLKVENKDLQQQIAMLNDKLQNASVIKGQQDAQRSFANASVNTDEDWTNLHSVVVDRMSFDREVERNKTLQRTVDELRYRNGELKATLAKARKASERAHANKANLQELEATKLELETCKRELEEYKERCKELDEECDTCGEYLRERDEHLSRLKEAKEALEIKLEAMRDKEVGSKLQSVRKKRQSFHDQTRDSTVQSRDAATNTAGDLHLESENSSSKLINESLQNSEVVQLKMALEAVSRQKQALELQLRAPALLPPVYVATGSAIVQHQHLTEVMKENQKLKRMNAKLITICKKRGKPLGDSNRENDDPADLS